MARFSFLALLFAGASALAAPTKVGNGDDGSDLEGFVPVTEGPFVASREEALKLLRTLHVEGVRGLGNLVPELKSSELYQAKETVNATLPEDQGTFHSNMTGQVYARTFARPHAATRFFPPASKLSEDQLVALHVHEALHRALPESVREDESVVAKITLAITAPGATHDQVRETAEALVPEPNAPAAAKPTRPEPSQVGYQIRQAVGPAGDSAFPRIKRLHSVYSYLYPFGGDETPFGMGLEASVVEEEGGVRSGPLGLSARMRLWSSRGFEVDWLGRVALNTLSAKELVNSAFGRDIYTIGLSIKKNFGPAYIENSLIYNFGGSSHRTIGRVEYEYNYGGVVNPLVRFGYQVGQLRLGAFGEIHLADHFQLSGGNFRYDTGRYRIIAAGPEVVWMPGDHLVVGCAGRFLVASNKDTDLSNLGDLMGIGVGQGGLEASVGYRF